MQREITYTGRGGPPAHRPGTSTHAATNSPPPIAVPHLMPPSPSRIPYGGVRPLSGQGNAAIPKDRISCMPACRSISPSPSAILERRDVKPDEDMSKTNVQLLRNEGMYAADPYMFHEGRMSMSSSQTGHQLDLSDHIFAYHRGAMRSTSTHLNSSVQPEMMEQSMYRQKSRKYTDSHLPSLGSKPPPSSPHRVTDIRMIDPHPYNVHVPPHAVQSDRSSPIHKSFKKQPGPPAFMDVTMTKARNASVSQAMVDVVPSLIDKQALEGYGPVGPPNETFTRERMQAMEKQIASLTGLVQSALLKGPNLSTAKDTISEKMTTTASSTTTSAEIGGGSDAPSGNNGLPVLVSTTAINHLLPADSMAVQVSLQNMRCNINEIRLQLHKMKQLQIHNQDMLRAMMKKTELEINNRVIETIKRLEDPVQRQRFVVEQERQKYLQKEETIVNKICDLEGCVDNLKKDAASVNKGVTLKDVEDLAFILRQIGEAVANLKGEFPPLQNKMRGVLRVEVEAVRFLKDEPHKLDSLLKRIRNITDVLTALRRHVTEGVLKGQDSTHKAQYTFMEKTLEAELLHSQEDMTHMQKVLQQHSSGLAHESKASSVKSEVVPFSTMTVHHVQSSPATIHQSQQSTALVNHPSNSPPVTFNSVGLLKEVAKDHGTPVTTQESVMVTQQTKTSQSPQVSLNGSSRKGFFISEIHHASFRNRAVSIEEAEKKWEVKRQNIDHYNGKEFEKLLEEAQANIMKSIPNLDVPLQSPKMNSLEKLEVIEESPDVEQGNDKVMTFPPPPSPGQIHPPGSGIATTRAGEVIHEINKENTKEPYDDVSPVSQSRISKSQAEDQASRLVPPVITDTVKKDDYGKEGQQIMAELQGEMVVQWSSRYGDAVQQSLECLEAETRRHHFNNNLEFFHEEVLKSDDGYDITSTAEFARVNCITAGTEQSPDLVENVQDTCQEQRDTHRVPEAPRITENEIPSLLHENSPFDKGVMIMEMEEDSKNIKQICGTLSGDSCSTEILKSGEQEVTFRVHNPFVGNEKPKINYRVSSVVDQNISENELRIVDAYTKISDVASADKYNQDSQIQELLLASKSLRERELPLSDYGQEVILRPKISKNKNVHNSEATVSICNSPSGENSPTDNIAFMITKTEVQVLSSGEVHDIVSRKGGDIETVKIDGRTDRKKQDGVMENVRNEDPVLCMDKKPVIIIFDEPMDIRSAYKRLSTIFEDCEEELDRMMSREKILEEEEDEESEMPSNCQDTSEIRNKDGTVEINNQSKFKYNLVSNPLKPHISEQADNSKTHFIGDDQINSGMNSDSPDNQFGTRDDVKKKFKFKFPKKQLAALTQAIRTGTKTGKKTLQVVVYEEEEEPDGTVKHHKEAKRFEIARSKSKDETTKNALIKQQQPTSDTAGLATRTDEIRKNTYRTLDSLEQTIKQLENTISEMHPKAAPENMGTAEDSTLFPSSSFQIRATLIQDEPKTLVESPSSVPSAPRKISSGTPQTSRMPIPSSSKSRQQGNTDKVGKQPKLQEPQRQHRQANGGTKKAGGDFKATSPTLPSSKIPAFSPTSGKSSYLPAYCGENPNTFSSSTKSPISSSNPRSPQTGRNVNSSSLIPSIPNGSLKNQNPTYTGKGHHLSFSPQTSNGRPPPSSFSSSPTSPTSITSLGQGIKNTRTINSPSFTSYKSQNGHARKTTTATTEETS